MRVLFLAPVGRTPGQLSRFSFLDEEIRALTDAGVDAFVLSKTAAGDSDTGRVHIRTIPDDSTQERVRTLGFLAKSWRQIPVLNLLDVRQCYRALGRERFAAELIAREDIDIIHSYFGWPRGFGGSLARVATGRPLVTGLRGSDINANPVLNYGLRLNASYDRALRQLLATADASIYVSAFLREQAILLGAPLEGRVILKGVRSDNFRIRADREAVRRELGWGTRPTALAVGGLVPIKGLRHVLDALAIVAAAGLDFGLVICGDGPEKDALRDQSRRLGIADRVTFAGRIARDQIPAYFAAADIFVHGALIEASGNVLLEAMASGVAIVCTDAGGPAEYVLDGRAGFVVPVGDAPAMADRILRLMRDPKLRDEYGRFGRARIEGELTYTRMIDATLAVYSDVLTAGRAPTHESACGTSTSEDALAGAR